MKRLFSIVAIIFSAAPAVHAGPTVSNVTSAQRPDQSRLVDIHYDLAADGPCTVWFVVSANGGTSWNIPAMTYTGDIGPAIGPSTGKAIVWDAGADIPGKVGSFKVRVYADDGLGTNMIFVPGGTFPYQNNTQNQIYVGPFLIDKYEVTNQRYCEYLNSADTTGGVDPPSNHWNANMEITQSGFPPNSVYAVSPGKQNYPIRFVNAIYADAFAAWLSLRDNRTYRLPTEQEWEMAAAWDNVQNIHWDFGFQSNNIDCTRANFGVPVTCVGNTAEVGHYNGTNGTLDSRSFFGCYDMSGNVAELTATFVGSCGPYGMTRGGWWGQWDYYCSTANRNCWGVGHPGVGFRLVLEPN